MTRRILMIDDEADIREVAQMGLELIGGWSVSAAGGGAEGLTKAAAEQPDAVLLDMMMPEMDGTEVFRRLRTDSMTGHIPVVFLTAKVQSADYEVVSQLGAEGVLAKPFDPLTLADEIAALLGWSD